MEISAGDPSFNRDSLFSYKCNICNKCCHGKGIQVNPYETMRLAECLKISTSDFREKYLYRQFLRFKDNSDVCVFLERTGCSVHKDRPSVCRLYPLGRVRLENGEEIFVKVKPHPGSEGEYGQDSTIGAYLEAQEVGPFIKAENAYGKLIRRMAEAALETIEKGSFDNNISQPETSNPEWILDPDLVIKKYCEWKGTKFPANTRQKLKLHLRALNAWVDGVWDPLS